MTIGKLGTWLRWAGLPVGIGLLIVLLLRDGVADVGTVIASLT